MTANAVGTRDPAQAVARGIADRVLMLLRSADRLDALDGRSGALTSEELRDDAGARDAAARQMVARTLRAASEPDLAALLRALVAGGAMTMSALAERRGLPRFVLARCVDDLADGGLAQRDLGPDTVAATPLAAALVGLLNELEASTSRELAERLGVAGR